VAESNEVIIWQKRKTSKTQMSSMKYMQ
jgi:hypothetical protein